MGLPTPHAILTEGLLETLNELPLQETCKCRRTTYPASLANNFHAARPMPTQFPHGDVNKDGKLDAQDIDAMAGTLEKGAFYLKGWVHDCW